MSNRLTLMCAGLVGLMGMTTGGCGPTVLSAAFQESSDPNIFGTLIDDRGTFEFNLNPKTGNLERVDADDGTIFFPTDGQEFSVARPDGSSVTTTPDGDNEVIIAVRGDPLVGSTDLRVDRESLGGISDLIPNARVSRQLATCEENQNLLDTACSVVTQLDLSAISQLIQADLERRGGPSLPAASIELLLTRYLSVVVDCCLAWQEYRDGGGDACPAG